MPVASPSAPTVLDPGWGLPHCLHALRPEAAGLLEQCVREAAVAADAALLGLLALRVGTLLGGAAAARAARATGRAAVLADWPGGPFSAAERDWLAYAEQLVMDVGALDDAQAEAAARHLDPAGFRDTVTALFVVEVAQRVEMAAPALLAPPVAGPVDPPATPAVHRAAVPSVPPATPSALAVAASPARPAAIRSVRLPASAGRHPTAHPSLHAALAAFQAAVVRGAALDPALTELVRLRCARHHDCRVCQTLRLRDAALAGVDATTTANLDRYETGGFDERTIAALRVTDGVLTRAGELPPATVASARAHLAAEERAELVLDIAKWSTQKVHVALGTDGADALPRDADGVSWFGFDAEGRPDGYSGDAPVPLVRA